MSTGERTGEIGASRTVGKWRCRHLPRALKAKTHAPKKLSTLAHNWLLANVKIGSSLNYVVNELQLYAPHPYLRRK